MQAEQNFVNHEISIHAPPRGATVAFVLRGLRLAISIHAPPRGATCFVEGSLYGWVISIHAPPRGATNKNKKNAEGLPFQFTPLREGRLKANARKFSDNLFQFTPLREGRRCLLLQQRNDFISIHAPPRGATMGGLHRRLFPDFNSRPSARGDGVSSVSLPLPCISIHAPPRGATAKDMQFLQIFCSTLTNQHGLTIVPRNLSRLFW